MHLMRSLKYYSQTLRNRSGMKIAKGWGKGERGNCSMGILFPICKPKSSTDMLCNNARIFSTVV